MKYGVYVKYSDQIQQRIAQLMGGALGATPRISVSQITPEIFEASVSRVGERISSGYSKPEFAPWRIWQVTHGRDS